MRRHIPFSLLVTITVGNNTWQDATYEVEPIEWRVLSVNGNDAFIMSDKVICPVLHIDLSALNVWQKTGTVNAKMSYEKYTPESAEHWMCLADSGDYFLYNEIVLHTLEKISVKGYHKIEM